MFVSLQSFQFEVDQPLRETLDSTCCSPLLVHVEDAAGAGAAKPAQLVV